MEFKVSRVAIIATLMTLIALAILGGTKKQASKRFEMPPASRTPQGVRSASPFQNSSAENSQASDRVRERLEKFREERQKVAYDAYKNAGGTQ